MTTNESGVEFEAKHVHEVYDEIAEHFSDTRYKPWPLISSFLRSLPPGSIGLDIGCGNGKYLSINPNIYILASDRSSPLVSIASSAAPATSSTIVADSLSLPHPKVRFDFATSIAVVHHLSTRERRREAIKGILECLIPEVGKALIYVWALEQRDSRRGWGEGDEQDRLVGWVMHQKKSKKEDREVATNGQRKDGMGAIEDSEPVECGKRYERYYHLYRQGELEEDVVAAGGEAVESGYERDNWWVIAKRAPPT